MRDYVLLYVNGRRHQIAAHEALTSLSDFLRLRLGLTGTKIVCSEGDCGACSVLVGRPDKQGLRYQVVDSCIMFLFQLDSCHVVTVEGITPAGSLTSTQQAMVDCHGSQCGFCTPGFVMALEAHRENVGSDCQRDLRTSLTGNLCRCTGYVSILEAADTADEVQHQRMSALYPPEPLLREFSLVARDEVFLADQTHSPGVEIFAPLSIRSAVEYLQKTPKAAIVAGATDLGVRINKGKAWPAELLTLNRIEELAEVEVRDGCLSLGARASWTQVEAVCRDLVPEFERVLSVFGSPQIRNMGTVGGNLINASPIADSLPFLCVMDARLELTSAEGSRTVNINDFYLQYKQFDLRAGELLTRVEVPLPQPTEILKLYKVSRRRDLDISSFTAAVRMCLDANNRIEFAALAFGGVGPTVIRARQTEDFLIGEEFSERTFQDAGRLAVNEVKPISDVRGSADYRLQLTRNVLRKFYYEHEPGAVLV